jgi:hypothetical protein
MGVEYRKGLQEAHRLLTAKHADLEREHQRTPGFFGLPRRRHHEIIAAGACLVELAQLILDEARRDSERPA